MRKLTAAGIIAAAAMGLSVQAGAEAKVYTITGGTFAEVEHSCTQITALFASTGYNVTRSGVRSFLPIVNVRALNTVTVLPPQPGRNVPLCV